MKAGGEDLILAQIRTKCEDGISFVAGMDRETFLNDKVVQHAVAMCIVVIGDAVAKLVKRSPDYVGTHPEVPWGLVVGMRNRIAHGYDGVDFEVVWDTIRQSIPDLLTKLPAPRV